MKNDQCHVEQKNGGIVRQVIGYHRFEGERAYQQIDALYQALRLYVNGFQPSMKLLAKHDNGRKVCRIYDAAKTPLQRLLLSGVLPASKEHDLRRVVQALDPLRLFHHLHDLQQALLGCTTSPSPDGKETASATTRSFCMEHCIASRHLDPASGEGARQEHMTRAIMADPMVSCQPKQDRNHRALSSHREACPTSVSPVHPLGEACRSPSQSIGAEQEVQCPPTSLSGSATQSRSMLSKGHGEQAHAPASSQHARQQTANRSIEQAIRGYLEHQRSQHRRPKTLQWHEQALGLFQGYLLTEHQCMRLDQITQEQIRGWFAALPLMPTTRGMRRSSGTVESYARSARAFCHWLVRHHSLQATPFAHLDLPPVKNRSLLPLQPEEWEQLLLACQCPKKTGVRADQAAARNRALLWVLFETGMQVSEVCQLRLGDIDREQGTVSVRGKGVEARWLSLGPQGLHHVLVYLDTFRLRGTARLEPGAERSEHLFLSEVGGPLTKGALALMFGRLRKRAAITRKNVSASLLRESFAERYVQTGGDQRILQELLGQQTRRPKMLDEP